MKILSFIIPSFNSEKFLDKCLNSFINSDVLDKLDIIIVNDGSTDSTPVIADKYASMHSDSIRVFHQDYRGHGGALNSGCSAAVGKYLKVIDADDSVITNNLSAFVEKLESLESDVVITHYYTTDIETGVIKKWMCYPKEYDRIYTMSDIMFCWDDFSRCVSFHGITYKTSFYKSVGYELAEKVFYEDHEFSTFPAAFASSVVPLDLFIYNYRIGDEAQSVSERNRLLRLDDTRVVLNRLANEYARAAKNEIIGEFICQKIKILLMSYLTTVLLVENDKKNGRSKANDIMLYFKTNIPRVYELSLKQYKVFRLFNFLGIRKTTFDRFLDSKLYRILKGARDFD